MNRRLLGGLAATASVAVAALRTGLTTWLPDELAPVWGVGLAAISAVGFGALVAVGAGWLRREWLALSCAIVPALLGLAAIGMTGLSDLPPHTVSALLMTGLYATLHPLDAVASLLWVGGAPRRRWWSYVVVLTLWVHVSILAAQCVLPGLVVYGLFALLPIVAARAPAAPSWLWESIRAIRHNVGPWLLLVVAGAVSQAVTVGVPAALAGGDIAANVMHAFMDPMSVDPWLRFAGDAASSLVAGAMLAVAAAWFASEPAVVAPSPGPADVGNPWSTR